MKRNASASLGICAVVSVAGNVISCKGHNGASSVKYTQGGLTNGSAQCADPNSQCEATCIDMSGKPVNSQTFCSQPSKCNKDGFTAAGLTANENECFDLMFQWASPCQDSEGRCYAQHLRPNAQGVEEVFSSQVFCSQQAGCNKDGFVANGLVADESKYKDLKFGWKPQNNNKGGGTTPPEGNDKGGGSVPPQGNNSSGQSGY